MKRPDWGQAKQGHHQIWDCSHFFHWTVNTFDKTEALFCFSDLWHSCWAQNKVGRATFHRFLSPSPLLMTIIPLKMTWTQSLMLVILVQFTLAFASNLLLSLTLSFMVYLSTKQKMHFNNKMFISGPEELLDWLIPIFKIRWEKRQRQS